MTQITIDAGTLTANEAERTVTGLLVPYGEECRSNLGKFSVSTGAFTIPSDPEVAGFNVEHVREDGIGRAKSLRETEEGIVATFSVARTPEGDAALADIASGKRKHLSAEVANVAIRAGQAVGGRLFGGALVEKPAFPSATLLAAAADVGDVEPIQPDDPDAQTTEESSTAPDGTVSKTVTTEKTETGADGTVTTTKTVTTVAVETPAQPDQTEETPVTGIPNTLAASAKSGASKKTGKRELFSLLAAHDTGNVQGNDLARLAQDSKATGLFAGLTDIKYDGTGGITTGIQLPDWIGEVWDGNDYIQRYLPLFDHGDLSSLKFVGFKWDVKPHGGDWAGNKSDVPSNAPKFKAVEGTASRYAMAHDIARELQDLRVFGDSSFFDAYFAAGTEDYKRWTDAKVLAAINTNASTLVADDPTGQDIGPAMSALIDGAAQVIANNAVPTFGLVELSYWKQIAKTPSKDVLGYLNAQLGLTGQDGQLDSFSLVPSIDLAPKTVAVGSRNALTVRELPGVPIRADALDIARGGVDQGLFGYAGVQVNKPDAIVLVTPYVGA